MSGVLPEWGFTFDRHGIFLAILLVGIALASAALVPVFQADAFGNGEPVEQNEWVADQSSSSQFSLGVGWAMAEAIGAGLLLGSILLIRRLPAWIVRLLTRAAKYAVLLLLGVYIALVSGSVGDVGRYVFVFVAAYLAFKISDELGYWWIANNIIVVLLAVLVGAIGGIVLGRYVMLAGLIGLAVYDHYFANRQSAMFTIAESLIRKRLPVLFVVAPKSRFYWDELMDGDEDDTSVWGIGTADLALPAMFVAALMAHEGGVSVRGVPIVVLAVLAALVVTAFRLRWQMINRGSGAGLPPITAACVIGLAAGTSVSVAIGVL